MSDIQTINVHDIEREAEHLGYVRGLEAAAKALESKADEMWTRYEAASAPKSDISVYFRVAADVCMALITKPENAKDTPNV